MIDQGKQRNALPLPTSFSVAATDREQAKSKRRQNHHEQKLEVDDRCGQKAEQGSWPI